MTKQIDAKYMEQLQHDNYHLGLAFNMLRQALDKTKIQEALLLSEAGENAARARAMQQASRTSEAEKEQAKAEGNKELKKTVKEQKAKVAQAMEAEKNAKKDLDFKCRPEWDRISLEKEEQLKACSDLESELSTAKAQQTALMASVKAKISGDQNEESIGA